MRRTSASRRAVEPLDGADDVALDDEVQILDGAGTELLEEPLDRHALRGLRELLEPPEPPEPESAGADG